MGVRSHRGDYWALSSFAPPLQYCYSPGCDFVVPVIGDSNTGGGNEKCSSRDCSACGDARRACDGSGHADQGARRRRRSLYYDWSGAYIGFNAGGIWSQVNQDFPNPALLGGTGPRKLGKASRPAPATASSASTPARSGSGAPGFWARKRR